METALYLVKVGELTLKSGNLKDFEQRLVQNAQLMLEGRKAKVSLRAGRMYIEGPEEAAGAIEYALTHLIGITGWARATVVPKEPKAMQDAVLAEALKARDGGAKTFKVEARRSDKSFPLNSFEIARLMGEPVFDGGIMAVDVHHPDAQITVEVRERCFVYGPENKGHRGLPCGTGGKGLLLLSGGIDSPVAGYRMLRRGMKDRLPLFPFPSLHLARGTGEGGKPRKNHGAVRHRDTSECSSVHRRPGAHQGQRAA